MIFYNLNRVCNNCQFISISDLPSSENEIDKRERSNSWRGDRIFKQLVLEMCDFENIKQEQYKCFETHSTFILYMFLEHLRQDFNKIFRYRCFFVCFHTSLAWWQSGPNRPWVMRNIQNYPRSVHRLCQLFFRRKLSKLDFDLHFCIMTSVWDFSNPPFYWMIS